jgi:hypothetical protein
MYRHFCLRIIYMICPGRMPPQGANKLLLKRAPALGWAG